MNFYKELVDIYNRSSNKDLNKIDILEKLKDKFATADAKTIRIKSVNGGTIY